MYAAASLASPRSMLGAIESPSSGKRSHSQMQGSSHRNVCPPSKNAKIRHDEEVKDMKGARTGESPPRGRSPREVSEGVKARLGLDIDQEREREREREREHRDCILGQQFILRERHCILGQQFILRASNSGAPDAMSGRERQRQREQEQRQREQEQEEQEIELEQDQDQDQEESGSAANSLRLVSKTPRSDHALYRDCILGQQFILRERHCILGQQFILRASNSGAPDAMSGSNQ